MSAANSAGLGNGWLLRNRATTALITGGTQGLGQAIDDQNIAGAYPE
jgi:hypothetical protein